MATFFEFNYYRILPSHFEFILVRIGYKSGDSDENYELEVYFDKIWKNIRTQASDIGSSFCRIKTKDKNSL